jgi:hypothetical protein
MMHRGMESTKVKWNVNDFVPPLLGMGLVKCHDLITFLDLRWLCTVIPSLNLVICKLFEGRQVYRSICCTKVCMCPWLTKSQILYTVVMGVSDMVYRKICFKCQQK